LSVTEKDFKKTEESLKTTATAKEQVKSVEELQAEGELPPVISSQEGSKKLKTRRHH